MTHESAKRPRWLILAVYLQMHSAVVVPRELFEITDRTVDIEFIFTAMIYETVRGNSQPGLLREGSFKHEGSSRTCAHIHLSRKMRSKRRKKVILANVLMLKFSASFTAKVTPVAARRPRAAYFCLAWPYCSFRASLQRRVKYITAWALKDSGGRDLRSERGKGWGAAHPHTARYECPLCLFSIIFRRVNWFSWLIDLNLFDLS